MHEWKNSATSHQQSSRPDLICDRSRLVIVFAEQPMVGKPKPEITEYQLTNLHVNNSVVDSPTTSVIETCWLADSVF
jgi:hypothetical protein